MSIFNIKDLELRENTKQAIESITEMNISKIEAEIDKMEYLYHNSEDKEDMLAYKTYLSELRKELRLRLEK